MIRPVGLRSRVWALRWLMESNLIDLLWWLSFNEKFASEAGVEESVGKVRTHHLKDDLKDWRNATDGLKHAKYFWGFPLARCFDQVYLKDHFVHYLAFNYLRAIVLVETLLCLLALRVFYLFEWLALTIFILDFVRGEKPLGLLPVIRPNVPDIVVI